MTRSLPFFIPCITKVSPSSLNLINSNPTPSQTFLNTMFPNNFGGGGGAGSGGPSTTDGGVGGNGAPFSNFPGPVLAPAIPGVPTWATVVGPTGLFAGGGGGSYQAAGSRAGGPGGGGTSGPSGSQGLDYTGGGGGGKSGDSSGGYDGGKGIVIIRRLT